MNNLFTTNKLINSKSIPLYDYINEIKIRIVYIFIAILLSISIIHFYIEDILYTLIKQDNIVFTYMTVTTMEPVHIYLSIIIYITFIIFFYLLIINLFFFNL